MVSIVHTHENYYSPFGMVTPGRSFSAGDGYRFGFNGKENMDGIYGSSNSIDFGARFYNNRLGVWLSVDPLSNVYCRMSPYAFALNTPIMAIDPDGRKVLFVNGYYNTGILKKWAGDKPLKGYWGPKFLLRAYKYFNDESAYFIDGRGGWNSSASSRFDAGYEYARQNFNSITSGIYDANGVQTETIKVVSHSMGAAYSEGVIKYLLEKNVEVEKVVHLSPADPNGISASSEVTTLQLTIENDGVLNYKNFGEGDIIEGVDIYGNVQTDRSTKMDLKKSHGDTKFNPKTFDALEDLENIQFTFTGNKSIIVPGGGTVPNSTIATSGTYEAAGNSHKIQFNMVYKDGKAYRHSGVDIYTGDAK